MLPEVKWQLIMPNVEEQYKLPYIRPISPDLYRNSPKIGDLLARRQSLRRFFAYHEKPRRTVAVNNQCYLLKQLINNSKLEAQEYISLCLGLERKLGQLVVQTQRYSEECVHFLLTSLCAQQ